jgi:hypothetical protein
MLFTGPGHRPARDDAAGVGEQDHPEQHAGRIGRGPGLVVPVPRIERRQVEGGLEQVVQRVLEGAREQLRGEVDGDEPRLGVDRLVARHGGLDDGDRDVQLLSEANGGAVVIFRFHIAGSTVFQVTMETC